MVVITGKNPDEVIYFKLGHGFYDEFAVVAEKEEASTGTSSFSRILNLFDILGRLQWFNDILIFDVVNDSNFSEGFGSILSYDDSSL